MVGPLVFKTLLTVAPGLISGEDTVMGFGFTSCEVMMEMPVGLEGIAGPKVNPLSVIVTAIETGIFCDDVIVRTMPVAVGAAAVAVAPEEEI